MVIAGLLLMPMAQASPRLRSGADLQATIVTTEIYDYYWIDYRTKATHSFADFRGSLLWIVAIPTGCQLTPMHEFIRAYHAYADRGLRLLLVPVQDLAPPSKAGMSSAIELHACLPEGNFGVTDISSLDHMSVDLLWLWIGAQFGHANLPDTPYVHYLIGDDGQAIQRFPGSMKPFSPEVLQVIESNLPWKKTETMPIRAPEPSDLLPLQPKIPTTFETVSRPTAPVTGGSK
jgi:glutathione peroxidase-family protein